MSQVHCLELIRINILHLKLWHCGFYSVCDKSPQTTKAKLFLIQNRTKWSVWIFLSFLQLVLTKKRIKNFFTASFFILRRENFKKERKLFHSFSTQMSSSEIVKNKRNFCFVLFFFSFVLKTFSLATSCKFDFFSLFR